MSFPSVNNTVNGDINVNIAILVTKLLPNVSVSERAFTLIFNDGVHKNS